MVQQDIIRSAGVKWDPELFCQAASFLFTSPPESVNLKTFSFQQWDQHSGCAPCAKHTDSWQHGSATHTLRPYVLTMASLTNIPTADDSPVCQGFYCLWKRERTVPVKKKKNRVMKQGDISQHLCHFQDLRHLIYIKMLQLKLQTITHSKISTLSINFPALVTGQTRPTEV